MKKAIAIAQMILAFFVVSACSSSTVVTDEAPKQPIVIHHEPPKLRMNTDWVEDAGCKLTRYAPWSYSGNCLPYSSLREMGCERIEANYLLGGLSYPVATCTNSNLEPLGPHSEKVGCLLSERTEALIALVNGTYQFVGPEDIKTLSVPIESPNEALSYVLASKDYYAMYDIEIESYYEYFVDQIDDTFVEETEKGYLVHLFVGVEPVCSCGDHYTDAVDILVTREGKIKIVDSHHFYKFDGCVD